MTVPDLREAGDLAAVADALRRRVPAGVAVGVADPRDDVVGSLFHVEHRAMRGAAPKRLREFAAGRMAAVRAQRLLGLDPRPVGVAADRSPVWPAGLCGSISHCGSAAVALVANVGTLGALGVDVEDDRPLPAEIADIVLGARERASIGVDETGQRDGLLIFSAKEAVYKAQYPVTGRLMEFDALHVELNADRSGFEARFLVPVGRIGKGYVVRGMVSSAARLVICVAIMPGRP